MSIELTRAQSIPESDSDASFINGAQHQGPGLEKSEHGSIRSRASKFSRITKNPSAQVAFSRTESKVKEKEKKTKSIFEWDEGGKNVHITGSWDNFQEKLPMESIRPGSYRIVLPIPATERVEYFFYVDGERRVASSKPSIVNEFGQHINVKHGEATISANAGESRRLSQRSVAWTCTLHSKVRKSLP